MTQTTPLLFTINLKHLSPDGKQASVTLPNRETYYVAENEVLALLKNVAAIAPTVEFPAEPEVKISGPTGKFIVRVKTGQLTLVSWSSSHKGGPSTPEKIMASIVGAEPEEVVTARPGKPGKAAGAAEEKSTIKDKLQIAGLAIAIVAVNAFTIWFVTLPPRGLDRKYQLLSPEASKRVIEDVAGIYETGKGPGDRRIEVKRDASMQRIKLGAGGAPKDKQSYTVQGADSSGTKALVTNRKTVVQVKDNLSVVMYGDTYTRVTQ